MAELDQKARMVQGIFSKIAPRYDTFNALSSLGIYKRWLARVAATAACTPDERVLDVAAGTGDVTFELCRRCPPACIEVSDFTPEMLDVARKRAQAGQARGVSLSYRVADAMDLPYEDESFDVVTISYGLRNFSDRVRAMRQAWRVLKPRGRAVILEFGTPPNALWRGLYHVYLRHVIPFLGGVLCADRSGFDYLASSILAFPPQETIVSELCDVGFVHVQFCNCSGGIAVVYEAHKA